MPQFRDFLARFRPAGSPGAASRLGVAADRARERSAELEPVLELLAATHAECEQIIAEATQEATQITQDAREQAGQIADEAGRRAEAARTRAASKVLNAARDQAVSQAQAAERQAGQPPRDFERQVSELVSAAIDLVRRLPTEGLVP